MAALCWSPCPRLLAPPAASTSGRQLGSCAHLSRPAPLLAARPGAGSAASSSCRDRTAVRVAAFQIPSSKWWLKHKTPPNVQHVSSVQQLVDAMASAGDRLVVIDVFAPWCAACKSLYPKVMKLLEERPDVLLLAVNFDENKTLVKALGVKVLPYFMFYRGSQGKLEEFSASSKRLHLIQEAIERHSTERCFLSSSDEEPVLKEFPNVVPAHGITLSASIDAAVAGTDRAPPRAAEPQPAAA